MKMFVEIKKHSLNREKKPTTGNYASPQGKKRPGPKTETEMVQR